jgi:hypothetical protein
MTTYAPSDTFKPTDLAGNKRSPILNLYMTHHHHKKVTRPSVSLLGVVEQINVSLRLDVRESPDQRGVFFMVRGLLETTDFFQDQIKQCRSLATKANNKGDRDFWNRLANRWENLLRAQERGSPDGELGREPINLPGGRLARVRYAPIATKFRSAAK